MGRVVLAAVLLVATGIAIPASGFLTARNSTTQPCGSGAFAFQGDRPVAASNSGAAFEARIATWNAEAANSTGAVVRGLRRIGTHSDVIGMQELYPESRRRAVEREFGRAWGISKADNAVQILWRTSRYERLAEGSERVFDVQPIESGVAGRSIGPKSIQWVQLRDKDTGAVVLVANHHLVPSIDRNGRPDTSNPKRLALAGRQLTAMVRLVGALRQYGPVFTTGDLNVDERMDARVRDASFPFVRMGAVGMVSNWEALRYPKGGTHGGRRLIDSVWVTAATAHFVDQQILSTFGSDHNAVVAVARGGSGGAPVAAAAAVFGASDGDAGLAVGVPDRLTAPGPTPNSTMELVGEQVEASAEIIRIGKANAIPEQGWVIALATALQESRLRNLDYGDRDSLGVFQQRPSTGWGTPAEVRDIALSVEAFYGIATHTHNPGLTDIRGWQSMTVAQAAQAVQISAFPGAYAQWEPAARSIVDQLAGRGAGSGGSCGAPPATAIGNCPPTGLAAEKGLTPDALVVIRCAHKQFPQITSIGGVRPDALPDHPSGRALDFMIPDYKSAAGNAFGWQVARWMRDHHAELGVQYVIYDAKIWNVLRDNEGWRTYGSITGHNDDSSLHRNHVHVSVFGGRATGSIGVDAQPVTLNRTTDWPTVTREPIEDGARIGSATRSPRRRDSRGAIPACPDGSEHRGPQRAPQHESGTYRHSKALGHDGDPERTVHQTRQEPPTDATYDRCTPDDAATSSPPRRQHSPDRIQPRLNLRQGNQCQCGPSLCPTPNGTSNS